MRVLLTTDTIGGVWTFTRELTQQLLAQGHAVALASFGREPDVEQSAWSSQMHCSHPAAFLYQPSTTPLEWMHDNALAYEHGAALLIEVAEKFRPDILHFSQYCFGRLPLDLPRLITAHSDVFTWAAACRPNGLDRSAWLDHYSALVQGGVESADVVVAPTRWMLHALRAELNVPCRCDVIYNGRTLPQTNCAGPRFLRGVSVGRLWDEAKGLASLARIRSSIPLLVAGEDKFDGSSACPASPSLHVIGKLREEELLELFRLSSIYVASSVYEPFGLAPLEAALCGCAIVARDLPSLREIWGSAAAYFDDNAALEALLGQLVEDRSALEAARMAAMSRAACFTGRRMADSYMALYSELIGSKAANGRTQNAGEEYACHAA